MTRTELLHKFISNKCNEEETKLVLQWLDEEPWLLDALLNKTEWDAVDGSASLYPGLEKEMKREILSKTIYHPFYRFVRPMMAAAAVLVIVFGLLFLNKTGQKITEDNLLAATPPVKAAIERIENLSNGIQEITLQDFSTVSLYPRSVIVFEKAFTNNRQIHLQGKAIFVVTKSAASPFTVYSGAITTTALGTKFLVDNGVDSNSINVKLYEGRVVIKPVHDRLHISDTYLAAGEECYVNVMTSVVKVNSLVPNTTLAHNTNAKKGSGHSVKNRQAGLLNFSNVALPVVLDSLQKAFNRDIEFGSGNIDAIYFTGSLSLSDSLEKILKVIATMNGLQIDTVGNIIQVSKELATIIPARAQHADKIISFDQVIHDSTVISPSPVMEGKGNDMADQPPAVRVEGDALHFIKMPLAKVFEEIQKHTKKQIHFNREDLGEANFTGSVPIDKMMDEIVSVICNSNGLKLTIKKKSFYITRIPQPE
jgi:ferric-dicitrate binding protein FerR (iron transport regulator)